MLRRGVVSYSVGWPGKVFPEKLIVKYRRTQGSKECLRQREGQVQRSRGQSRCVQEGEELATVRLGEPGGNE